MEAKRADCDLQQQPAAAALNILTAASSRASGARRRWGRELCQSTPASDCVRAVVSVEMATTDGAAKLSTVERVVKSKYMEYDCCLVSNERGPLTDVRCMTTFDRTLAASRFSTAPFCCAGTGLITVLNTYCYQTKQLTCRRLRVQSCRVIQLGAEPQYSHGPAASLRRHRPHPSSFCGICTILQCSTGLQEILIYCTMEFWYELRQCKRKGVWLL